MEIVVTGRNVEVPDHFREHVAEKVARLERYDHKIVGLEVELFHERNRRQLKNCQRVEITGRGCGLGVARAEACAQDFYAALDAADRQARGTDAPLPRPAPDHRRRSHRAGRGRHAARRAATRRRVEVELPVRATRWRPAETPRSRNGSSRRRADLAGRRRRATSTARPHRPPQGAHRHPMSVDDALSRMELVGHDFYLFSDAETGAAQRRLPPQGLRLRGDPPSALDAELPRGAVRRIHAERGPPLRRCQGDTRVGFATLGRAARRCADES